MKQTPTCPRPVARYIMVIRTPFLPAQSCIPKSRIIIPYDGWMFAKDKEEE